MPRKLSKGERERFAKGRRVAVLGTYGPEGEIVLTPIWYLYRGGKFLMRTSNESLKAKNVRRNPNVSVCIQEERAPYVSATAYGKATIEPKQEGLGAKMARHYLGAIAGAAYMRVAAEAIEEEGGEVTIVVMPERWVTQDFTPDTPIYGRGWLLLRRILPPWL